MSSALVRLADVARTTGLERGIKEIFSRKALKGEVYVEQVGIRTIAMAAGQPVPAMEMFFRFKDTKTGETLLTSPKVFSRVGQHELSHDAAHLNTLAPFNLPGEFILSARGRATNEATLKGADTSAYLGTAEDAIRKHIGAARVNNVYKSAHEVDTTTYPVLTDSDVSSFPLGHQITHRVSPKAVRTAVQEVNDGFHSLNQKYPGSLFENYFDVFPIFTHGVNPDHRVALLQNQMQTKPRQKFFQSTDQKVFIIENSNPIITPTQEKPSFLRRLSGSQLAWHLKQSLPTISKAYLQSPY